MQNFENTEQLSDWRKLKAEASERAQALIQDIPGFTSMDSAEKITELSNLLNRLAEDNSNRYVAGEVARMRAITIEESRHTLEMERLMA